MTHKWPRRFGAAASMGVLLAAIGLLAPSLPATGPGASSGAGDLPAQEEVATMRLGPSDPDQVVDFQVVLRQPGRADLEAFLSAVADPSSS
ncbi:MAG: hypothetical protein M3395_07200, partial [Chloroflexota bacterium]|nr:hypothetical protein [Chloroflexota bacterium]